MATANNNFHGIWPALVTPFNGNGKIDITAYRELISWYLDQGVDGLFGLCLSSEVFELDEAERLDLARIAVETNAGRVPFSALASFGDDIETNRRFGQKLIDLGVDVVVLTQPEFCETETELEAYFLNMADMLPCTFGLYECPFPRKRIFSPDLLSRLARSGRFGLLKETSRRIDVITAKVRAAENTPLAILQADAGIMVESHSAGSDGCISVVAGVVPRLAGALWEQLERGANVSLLHDLLLRAEILRKPGQPLGTKFLLQLQGLPITTTMRRKIVPLHDAEMTRIESGWNDLQHNIALALDLEKSSPFSALRDDAAEAMSSPKFQIEGRRFVDLP